MEDRYHGTMTLEFHGCLRWPGGCKSSGAASQTIVTKPLAMDLAKLPGEEGIGIALDAIGSNNFAEFTCGGIVPVQWSGSLIGKITDPGYGETTHELSLDFEGSEGSYQKPDQTYHGREGRLVSHV